MTNATKKVYRSLTKNELGIHVGTHVNEDGSVIYTLDVNGEPRSIRESTLKRWWRLQEEVEEQPTIEDLQKLNESGVELTEEELETFKKEAQAVAEQKVVEKTEKTKPKKREMSGVQTYLEEAVTARGGEFHLYSEGRGGVIKAKGKPAMFFGFRKHGAVRLFMRETLDEMLNCPYEIVEKHSYPKQFPFRIDIPTIDDESKVLLDNILSMYI